MVLTCDDGTDDNERRHEKEHAAEPGRGSGRPEQVKEHGHDDRHRRPVAQAEQHHGAHEAQEVAYERYHAETNTERHEADLLDGDAANGRQVAYRAHHEAPQSRGDPEG